MKQSQIIEETLVVIKNKSTPYINLYNIQFKIKDVKLSEFEAGVKELISVNFVNYGGNFNDDIDIVLTGKGEDMLERYKNYKNYMKFISPTKSSKWKIWMENSRLFLMGGYLISGIAIIAGVITNWTKIFPSPQPNSNKINAISEQARIASFSPMSQSNNVRNMVKTNRMRSDSDNKKKRPMPVPGPMNEPTTPTAAETGNIRQPAPEQKKSSSKIEYNYLFNGTIKAPLSFYPNSNKNNIFRVYGTGVQSFDIVIFNSTGTKVFETSNIDEGWNGRNRFGDMEKGGVFSYMITIQPPNSLFSRTSNGQFELVP